MFMKAHVDAKKLLIATSEFTNNSPARNADEDRNIGNPPFAHNVMGLFTACTNPSYISTNPAVIRDIAYKAAQTRYGYVIPKICRAYSPTNTVYVLSVIYSACKPQ